MTGIDRFFEIMDTPIEIVDDKDAEVLENAQNERHFQKRSEINEKIFKKIFNR